MNEQTIVWTSVIVLMVVAFIVRGTGKFLHTHHMRKHRRVIEVGKENGMFYCPGDQYDNEEDL